MPEVPKRIAAFRDQRLPVLDQGGDGDLDRLLADLLGDLRPAAVVEARGVGAVGAGAAALLDDLEQFLDDMALRRRLCLGAAPRLGLFGLLRRGSFRRGLPGCGLFLSGGFGLFRHAWMSVQQGPSMGRTGIPAAAM
jgi:hypothetical protein